MKTAETRSEEKLGLLNLLILVLSIYVLLALMFDTFLKLPEEVSRLLLLIDNIICIVFLVDFLKRLYQADNRLKFMKWGWIYLVSSIPHVGFYARWPCIQVNKIVQNTARFPFYKTPGAAYIQKENARNVNGGLHNSCLNDHLFFDCHITGRDRR